MTQKSLLNHFYFFIMLKSEIASKLYISNNIMPPKNVVNFRPRFMPKNQISNTFAPSAQNFIGFSSKNYITFQEQTVPQDIFKVGKEKEKKIRYVEKSAVGRTPPVLKNEKADIIQEEGHQFLNQELQLFLKRHVDE